MGTREIVLAYLRAVEATDPAEVKPFLHPDVVVTEHPNKLNPAGATYDRAGVRAAATPCRYGTVRTPRFPGSNEKPGLDPAPSRSHWRHSWRPMDRCG